jgi:hypothetical protein
MLPTLCTTYGPACSSASQGMIQRIVVNPQALSRLKWVYTIQLSLCVSRDPTPPTSAPFSSIGLPTNHPSLPPCSASLQNPPSSPTSVRTPAATRRSSSRPARVCAIAPGCRGRSGEYVGSLAELERLTPRRRMASGGWEGIGEGVWNVACEVEMGGGGCAGGVWRSFAVDMVAMVSSCGYDSELYTDLSQTKKRKQEDMVPSIRPHRCCVLFLKFGSGPGDMTYAQRRVNPTTINRGACTSTRIA